MSKLAASKASTGWMPLKISQNKAIANWLPFLFSGTPTPTDLHFSSSVF